MKPPFIIYVDTKSLLEKLHTCENNPQNLFTTKLTKDIACSYSIFTE